MAKRPANTSTITVTPDSITVAENSSLAPIGILAPTDSQYPASRLSVTVTGLPTDGTVYLSDGVTAVYNGEKLTIAQLTALLFKPKNGLFGTSSSFTYTVSDPSGVKVSGTANLTIAPDSIPPVTTAASLTVVQNAVANVIGIAAPTDPNYSASQLTVKVTGLPSDGTVLLADGRTQVTAGQVLSVAQLTGLMFKPTSDRFGTSSAFTYTVTDPSGLSATGTASLTIGPDTIPPSTTPVSLSVDENASATSIGISAPTDPSYSESQLSVVVTAAPSDGTVLLADGTQVSAGTTLSASQLSGLMFEPTPGVFGTSSDLVYTVTNPSGLTGTGTAVLTISPDSKPPVTTDPMLTVAPNSGATPIGIPAPSDPNYSASELSITVTGLPSDGMVLLPDGVTAVTLGEQLTTTQLTELLFRPTLGLSGQSSDFTYTVSDPAGLSASGLETLTIAAPSLESTTAPNQPSSGLWHDPSVSVVGSAGVDVAPRVAQPSQAGDIVGVRLQNTGSATEPSGYVSFGQVFLPGAVQAGESLVARINGVNYAVQMDVKSTNADGSVRQAVLTFNAPSIAAGGTVDLMLANGTGAGFSSTAPSASALLAAGYNVGVSFSFHNADGSMTTDSASAATALQAALNAGSVKSWLAGPGVNEYDVITTVDSGKLKVEFDIRAYADGTTRTDVIFDNGWMFAPGKTNLNYDVSINQGGQSLYSAAGVAQYLYSVWHHEVDSAGSVNPNIQYDVPYLMASGAIPAYDVSYGVSDAAIRTNYGALNPSSTGYGSTGPMGTAEVQPVMPTTGGRPDLATQPNWVAQWLLSQNASAESVMMANADASGGVPWHLTDESTGKPISELTYPLFYDDPRNVTGSPYYSPQPANGFPTYGQNGDPWRPQTAHMPDLNYVPYLVTGSNYQLELLQSAADFAITSMDPYYAFNLPNGANPTSPGSAVNLGLASYHNEDRAIAWGIREVAEAAYLTPDSDPLKEYFVSELNKTMNGLVQYYIIDNMNAQYGGIQGFLVGYNEIVGKSVPPWQQDYIVTALAEVAGMNLPQASDDAVQILKYMNNFVSGLYTNAQNGYNPVNGAAYYLTINDPTTGNPYTSWSQLAAGNASTYPPNATTFQHASWATDTQGGYAVVAKAALADEITYTKSAQAIQAYGFLITQIAVIWNDPVKEAAAYETSPMWSVMPRLPDGVYLSSTQMQIDTSGSSVVNLTATGGDSLLSVAGNGTARLTGGTGTCDLLFGGSGPTTLAAGTGNDYLFGGSASNTFVDNTGNNYMQGAGTGNLFVFEENNSGHDVIANFNVSSDRLQIGANLNGDGFTTAAQLLAAATIVNGNTVLHLSPNDDITLFGITQPTKLANSILVF